MSHEGEYRRYRSAAGKEYPVKIMIVDEDQAAAADMAELLTRSGHDVVLADDLYCMEHLRAQGNIDMVITDIFMYHRSGLQIVLDVKGYDAGIKVIAVAGRGNGDADYLDCAVEFGADAVLRKPVDGSSVVSLVERLSCGS